MVVIARVSDSSRHTNAATGRWTQLRGSRLPAGQRVIDGLHLAPVGLALRRGDCAFVCECEASKQS